jgi:hypothetical protein
VSQIARTIAKVLRLHEELTESIALGHDLGHTPFGHAGERVLDSLMPGGFRHYEQSLRVVDVLENDGKGLNLSWEVRDGIGRHSKGKDGSPVGLDPEKRAATLEGQVMRVADLIAYVNHDIDDAVRAGVLRPEDLPRDAVAVLGGSSSARIASMVKDVVTETQRGELTEIRMSAAVLSATLAMRSFLFSAVYENDTATAEFKKTTDILGGLWERVREHPSDLLDTRIIETDGLDVAGEGLPRRHDRSLRGRAVRTPLHSEAMGRSYGVESTSVGVRSAASRRVRRLDSLAVRAVASRRVPGSLRSLCALGAAPTRGEAHAAPTSGASRPHGERKRAPRTACVASPRTG